MVGLAWFTKLEPHLTFRDLLVDRGQFSWLDRIPIPYYSRRMSPRRPVLYAIVWFCCEFEWFFVSTAFSPFPLETQSHDQNIGAKQCFVFKVPSATFTPCTNGRRTTTRLQRPRVGGTGAPTCKSFFIHGFLTDAFFQPDFGHMDERSLYDRSSHNRHGTAFEQEGPRAERPGVNSSLAQLRYIQNSAAKLDDRLKLVK